MQSVLLHSGNIKNYTALGQDGTPVYEIASQLRDTIKFRVKHNGKRFANYLAIPQRNDQGDHFDWYIPFESDKGDGQYTIVPWNEAPLEARRQAYQELHTFEEDMLQFGIDLQKQGNLQGDMLLFSRLLYDQKPNELPSIGNPNNLKALRFPSSDHVYLVNGHPVITFWGFTEKNAKVSGEPFTCLKAPTVVKGATATSQITPSPPPTPTNNPSCLGRFFSPVFTLGSCLWRILWSLLSLIILAALCLLFLRSCTHVDLSDWGLDWFNSDKPSEQVDGNPKDRCLNNELYHYEKGKWVNTVTKAEVSDSTQITLLENLSEDSLKQCEVGTPNTTLPEENLPSTDKAEEPEVAVPEKATPEEPEEKGSDEAVAELPDGKLPVVPETGDASPNGATSPDDLETPDTAEDATPAVPEANQDTQATNKAADQTDDQASDNATTPPDVALPDETATQDDTAGTNDTAQQGTTPADATATDTTSSGATASQDKATTLAIPNSSLKDGNLDFLNGQWTANSGLQDRATGKPIRLNYQFKDGDGQVQIKRSDGVVCKGNVNASLQKGSLTINKGVANCSDHSSYKLPLVNCKPDKNGKTDCQGTYSKGDKFPITMKAKH